MTVAGDPHLLVEGDPSDDPRAFRQALGQFATGVTVVTTMADGEPVAVTANSFSSVSLDPPMVLWSLRRASSSFEAFRRCGHFAINVLAADQTELSGQFARTAADKFGDVPWSAGLGGVPLLPGVAARFECEKAAEHDGGDHLIFLGTVRHYACYDRVGLVFSQGRYALPLSHPGRPSDLNFDVTGHPRDDFFLPLLARSYAYLSGAFSEHRDAEEVTVNQSRVLAFLATCSGASAEVIASFTFIGETAVKDAITKLLARGSIAPRPPGALVITPDGMELLQRIVTRAHGFEEEQLADLPPEDVAAARRVLRALAERGGR